MERILALGVRSARKLVRPVWSSLDRVAGSAIIGRAVRFALLGYYRARYRRNWIHGTHPPHFSDFGCIAAEFGFGRLGSVGSFYRAFHSMELIRPGDAVLDIGCGDGFAAARFFSQDAKRVDALDIDPEAIAVARSENPAPNVTYHQSDAVQLPLPEPPYDVVVWDGAIGHFPADLTQSVLQKVREALAPNGVFTGSESLGSDEGKYDHLQFFSDIQDVANLLGSVFPMVQVRERSYPLHDGSRRREAYFRCAVESDRLGELWRQA